MKAASRKMVFGNGDVGFQLNYIKSRRQIGGVGWYDGGYGGMGEERYDLTHFLDLLGVPDADLRRVIRDRAREKEEAA